MKTVKGNPNFVYWEEQQSTPSFEFGKITPYTTPDLTPFLVKLNDIENQIKEIRVIVDFLYLAYKLEKEKQNEH